MADRSTNAWVEVSVTGAKSLTEGRWKMSADEQDFLLCSAGDQHETTVLHFQRAACRLEKQKTAHVLLNRNGLLDQYELEPIRMELTLPDGERAELAAVCSMDNIQKLSGWGLSILPVFDLLDKPDTTENIICAQGNDLLPDGARFEVWRAQDELVLLKRDSGLYTSKRTVRFGRLAVQSIRSVRQTGEVRKEAYQIPGTPGGIQLGKAVLIGALLAVALGCLGAIILSALGLIAGIAVGVIIGVCQASEEGTPARTEYREIDERKVIVDIDQPDGGAASILFRKEAWEPLNRLLTPAELQGGAYRQPGAREGLADELERLSALYEDGKLTVGEFEQAKSKLLAQL